ncbi:hypothetical protein [Anaerolinea sp.]|uniref:ABC transporter permease n=1 Tax=Anaerolinea sp. TaxID=1872519 RepID=UPI002ACE750C|nr:hypothetical protein [Anaerolinea sp.]
MKGIINEEFSRAFRNRRLWIVVGISVLCLAVGLYRRGAIFGWQPMNPVNLLMNVSFYTPFSLFAALLATLPFTDSFLEDRKQGFLRHVVSRVPFRKYLLAKSLAVGMVGGVAVSGSILIMAVLVTLTGPVDFASTSYVSNSTLGTNVPWGPLGWLYSLNPFAYLVYLLASSFIFGAVYALLGLAISALVSNRYIVLAAPLVFFQVFAYLEERSLRILPAWNPHYTLFPFEAYEGFSLMNMIVQFGLLLLAAVLCLIVFARRQRMIA